jgi:hypothetical protein
MRYVLPGPFDWGLAKEHGGLILLASGLGYLACLAVAVPLLRQVWVRGYPFLAALTAGVAVVPAALMPLLSVGTQLGTAHYQEDVHVVADHERTLEVLRQNGVRPGNRGREYVCRRLLRRLLRHLGGGEQFPFHEWVEEERRLLVRRLREGRRAWRRNRDRPPSWWWETFGILPEEIPLLGGDP